jgi:hypothetical protein
MFEFLVGIGIGIWIGTTYNCRPYMEFLAQTLQKTANTPINNGIINGGINNIDKLN